MLGNKLKHILIDKKVGQKELAELTGTSQAFISYVLNDVKMPSVAVLKKIADYLNVSIDELLKDDKTA